MKKSILFLCLALFSFILFTGNVNAAEIEVPELPEDVLDTYYDYIVYTRNDDIELIIFTSSDSLSNAKFSKAGSGQLRYSGNGSAETTFTRYTYAYSSSSNSWYSTSSPSVIKTSQYSSWNYDGTVADIHYCSRDVYMSETSTEVFFQKTPFPTAPTLQEVIAEELPVMANKIIQAMKIILLCGVGCLALLIGLNLLPKILYRFL